MITDSMDVYITYPGGGREAGKFIAKGDKEIKVTSVCYDKLGSDQVIGLQRIEKGMFLDVAQATVKCSKNSDNPTSNVTLFNNQKFLGAIKAVVVTIISFVFSIFPTIILFAPFIILDFLCRVITC
jgi:hypothetical protein